jgi:uncharacterized protein HemY
MKRGISQAVTFLRAQLSKVSNTYTLALLAYAFELAGDSAKETVLAELMKNVVREGETKLLTDFNMGQCR